MRLMWRSLRIGRDIPAEIISAYRGLLRAASYLPDSVARRYAYDRIKSRFRASRLSSEKGTSNFTIQRLTKARRSRRLLEDAGNGDLDALKKVFLAVYGREGERKRALVGDLLKSGEEALPNNASALQELIDTRKGTEPGNHVLEQKFLKFMRSQQENQPLEAHKGKIRQLKAKIPEKNIWGRKTPVKLQKSLEKKWWADLLEKILPPVPRSEWERLRDLATGAIPLEARPAQRTSKPTTEEELSPEEVSKRLLEYFQTPARQTEKKIPFYLELDPKKLAAEELSLRKTLRKRGKARIRKDLMRTEKRERLAEMEKLNAPTTSPEAETKDIRDRSLRRLYASIWSLTPTMTYDEVNKKWDIEWGGQKSRALEGAVSKPTPAEEELFEGLDKLSKDLRNSGKSKG